MLASERHRIIVEELEQKGNVTVKGLKELLNVSLDTIRRDLESLEKWNKLQRVHGGAVVLEESVTNQPFLQRAVIHLHRKQQLALTAMTLIKEGQAIALNAGTTSIEVAKQLVKHFDRLTVITNSLKVAECLAVNANFTIILPGGVLNVDEYSLHGKSFEREIAQFNIDVAFISVNAISLEKGLTDFRQGEAEVINSILRHANQKIVVADSSKFETISYLNICPITDIHAIVTDSQLLDTIYAAYHSHQVKVIV